MKTKIIKIDARNPREEDLQQAASVINSGGLVIIPTETVYGIAADMSNTNAIIKLSEIKKRPKDKPFSLLIGRNDMVENYAAGISAAAYKLIEKFWPGPLTLVLKSKLNGTIGIRMPDNEITLRILDLANVPVACPSANLSGKPAPVDFESAIKDFNGLVDLAIDAGRLELGVESSVVDLSGEKINILREAAVKKNEIEETVNKKTVLFVCTGNSCRSVMAQAQLIKRLKEEKRGDVEVLSAGIMMLAGTGATEATKQVLLKEGIDVSSHASQKITKEMLKKSDLILVMEQLHEQKILQIAPELKNRVFLLKEFIHSVKGELFNGIRKRDDNLDIEDPIGQPIEFYEQVFAVIKEAVEKITEIV